MGVFGVFKSVLKNLHKFNHKSKSMSFFILKKNFILKIFTAKRPYTRQNLFHNEVFFRQTVPRRTVHRLKNVRRKIRSCMVLCCRYWHQEVCNVITISPNPFMNSIRLKSLTSWLFYETLSHYIALSVAPKAISLWFLKFFTMLKNHFTFLKRNVIDVYYFNLLNKPLGLVWI